MGMGSARFDVEKLTDKIDFSLWKMKVRALLIHQGLGAALRKEEPSDKGKGKVEDFEEIQEKAHSMIILCLGDKVLREVSKETTAVARLHLDACSGGTYWLKSAEEITHIMDGIASNSFQMKMDRSNHHRVAQVEESDAMKTMITTLMEKFDAFSSSMPRETLPPLVHDQQGVQEVNFMGKQNFQGGNYHQGKQNFQSQPQGKFPQNSQGRYNATSNFQ
ncbi:hypothetical protein ACS0TY_008585 [Phlomoides rotata]